VEGCEQQRAEEIGELAVDLAIVALQLAAPKLDTRSMCRLDSRRGSVEKRIISEANGYYNGSWTRKEPGCHRYRHARRYPELPASREKVAVLAVGN
jgi:hypothetical protein